MLVYAQCADMPTKTFMLQIAVSQRPMAKLKIKKKTFYPRVCQQPYAMHVLKAPVPLITEVKQH
jgi:hypothetical protein